MPTVYSTPRKDIPYRKETFTHLEIETYLDNQRYNEKFLQFSPAETGVTTTTGPDFTAYAEMVKPSVEFTFSSAFDPKPWRDAGDALSGESTDSQRLIDLLHGDFSTLGVTHPHLVMLDRVEEVLRFANEAAFPLWNLLGL